MINKNNKPKGFIAILSLLIITAVSMIFSMLILKDGVDNASMSLQSIYYDDARLNMNICIEDTIIRLKKEEAFNKNLNYEVSDNNSCSTKITLFPPQQISPFVITRLANVEVTGVSHGFSRKFDYELKIFQYKIYNEDTTFQYMNNIDIISVEEISI